MEMTMTRWIAVCLFLPAFSGCSGRGTNSPRHAVPIFEQLGDYHMAVTTSNTDAQIYFDQGLRLVYGFNHDEAEKAFREAARLDQDCAMAWWGVAYCLGPNINLPMDPDRNKAALDAIAKALAASEKTTERERAYVQAI